MCGIIGIVGRIDSNVNQALYDGLTVLQHRGQDAAGIMTEKSEKFNLRKGNGLVSDVFYKRHMQKLLGHIGIGHVRYPTAGSSSTAEAQPFYVNSPYGLALAHNGNLTNNSEIARELIVKHRRHVNTTSDSEVLLNHLAVQLDVSGNQMSINGEPFLDVDNFFDAVKTVNETVTGGYACVGLVNGYGLFAFRDPHGIRPLIYGKREYDGGTEWVVASESVAITALGFEIVADVQPGEAIFISSSGHLFSKQCAEKKAFTPCIF